jgi:hypothetical protein
VVRKLVLSITEISEEAGRRTDVETRSVAGRYVMVVSDQQIPVIDWNGVLSFIVTGNCREYPQ